MRGREQSSNKKEAGTTSVLYDVCSAQRSDRGRRSAERMMEEREVSEGRRGGVPG